MPISTPDEAALLIATFVIEQVNHAGPVTDFTGPAPLCLTETLDSVRLLELAGFIEDSFDVQIEDDEIVPENFSTVADVVRILRDKGALTSSLTGEEGRKGVLS
jgi:acyl carrier protein